MATRETAPEIVQLISQLNDAGIPFMLVGMTAANLQGVLATTLDVDIWVGLPPRQYMKVINICHRLGATLRSPNKVYLRDGTPVDFIYEVTGLGSFKREVRSALTIDFHGTTLSVLPLDRICASKRAAARDKDKLHILMIEQLLSCKSTGDTPKQRSVRARKTRN